MTIGILYICTGQYDVFWEDFYLACEKFFLPDCEKHYFLFTDSKNISPQNDKIHIIDTPHHGWPNATLLRFHFFLSIEDLLVKTDYLFFFNANLKPHAPIGREILPTQEGIVVFRHPWFLKHTKNKLPYERNPLSKAYIPHDIGGIYVQGALIGGTSNGFISMCHTLAKNIDVDLSNNIVAVRHDESHLNKYITDNTYKLLGPEYLYPEGFMMPYSCLILYKDKSKVIPVDKIKGHSFKYFNKFLVLLSKISKYMAYIWWKLRT